MPDTDTAPDTVDGEAEEIPTGDLPDHHPPTPTELVPRPSREALVPIDAEQVIDGMRVYQELLPKLLVASDWQDAGRGERFVKKSGWRKIARAFNLSIEIKSSTVERDPDGNPMRAEVIARAIAPNGQVQDGDGYCAVDESRFGGSGGRAKLENDLRATATTRAKNRAISDLVGMGEVSAEEVGGPDAGPLYGAPVAKDDVPLAGSALVYLLDDEPAAAAAWQAIKDDLDYMPAVVADTIRRLARILKEMRALDEATGPTAAEAAEAKARAAGGLDDHPPTDGPDPAELS